MSIKNAFQFRKYEDIHLQIIVFACHQDDVDLMIHYICFENSWKLNKVRSKIPRTLGLSSKYNQVKSVWPQQFNRISAVKLLVLFQGLTQHTPWTELKPFVDSQPGRRLGGAGGARGSRMIWRLQTSCAVIGGTLDSSELTTVISPRHRHRLTPLPLCPPHRSPPRVLCRPLGGTLLMLKSQPVGVFCCRKAAQRAQQRQKQQSASASTQVGAKDLTLVR